MRVILADDERTARTRLRRLLADVDPGATVVAECGDGPTTLDMIRRLAPDVLFLDVQMPELDGLDVARVLARDASASIVFVTAFDDYAVRAFEVDAVDYLLKPVGADRLRAAWERVKARRLYPIGAERRMDRVITALEALRRSQGGPGTRPYRDQFLIPTGAGTIVVPASEINWFEAAGNYVRVHSNRVTALIREPLAQLAEQLDPAQFIRIHRTAIVNIGRIKSIEPWFSGASIVILATGDRLTLSRSHRAAFLERFAARPRQGVSAPLASA